ncbi:Cytochrome b5 reductase 4, partial [Tolypocladium paradoxum]
MGLLGISLIVASVVYFIVRLPAWLSPMLFRWIGLGGVAVANAPGSEKRREEEDTDRDTAPRIRDEFASNGSATTPSDAPKSPPSLEKRLRDRAAMPPPPLPLPTIQPPTIQPPTIDEPESPTTPKAAATRPPQPIPSFTLSDEPPAQPSAPKPSAAMMPPPPPLSRLPPAGRIPSLPQFPAASSAQRARGPVPNRGTPSRSPGGLAPPPTHSSR